MKKNAVIIILCLLVLGLGGYIVYDSIIKEEPKQSVESTVDTDENLDEVATTLKNIVDTGDVFKFIGYDATNVTFSKETFENDEDMLGTVLTILDEEKSYDYDKTWNVTSADKINQYLQKNFGIDSLSKYPDISIHGTNYKYDESSKKYTATLEYATDSGLGKSPDYSAVYSIEKNDDEYVLTLATATVGDGVSGSFGVIYFDRYQTMETTIDATSLYTSADITDLKDDYKIVLASLFDEYLKSNKNEIPVKYQFTFKKNTDGSFYITKFQEIK
jgi:hypothetical protein